MPVTFPKPSPALEAVDNPRIGELPRQLRSSATPTRETAVPAIFRGGPGPDPQAKPGEQGEPMPDTTTNVVSDAGPQPAETPTQPITAGHVEPDKSME